MAKTKRGFKHFLLRLGTFIAFSYLVIPYLIKLIFSIADLTTRIQLNYLYVMLFLSSVILLFIFYNRKRLLALEQYKQSPTETIIFSLLSLVFFTLYFYLSFILTSEILGSFAFNLAFAYSSYFIASLFLLLAIFNLKFIKKFYLSVISAIIVSAIFFQFTTFLRANWFFFANTVSKISYWLLTLSSDDASLAFEEGAPTLALSGFKISIGAPCSGIDSLSMFTALFLLILIYDWNIFNKKKVIISYVIGAIGMFVMVILRIYLLMLIGIKNPALALGLFHTNAGWILFVLYFFVFFYIAYPRMKNK